MSDKKIRIKVSELRQLIREAMNPPIASRQNMIQASDDEEDADDALHNGKGKEQLNDSDLAEVAPPGWEGTVKAMKKDKDIDNPWALAWSMKDKGYKSHKKDTKKESKEPVVELRSFEDDFAEKISDKKYEAMAKQIFDAWHERGVDVDWAGVVNLFARNHSKNLGQEVDKTKLYEKVLDLVEKSAEDKFITVKGG